jgi:hypothetical protein
MLSFEATFYSLPYLGNCYLRISIPLPSKRGRDIGMEVFNAGKESTAIAGIKSRPSRSDTKPVCNNNAKETRESKKKIPIEVGVPNTTSSESTTASPMLQSQLTWPQARKDKRKFNLVCSNQQKGACNSGQDCPYLHLS